MKKLREPDQRQLPAPSSAAGAGDGSTVNGSNRRRSSREPVVTLGMLQTLGRADGTDNVADTEGEIISSDLQIALARPLQVLVTNVSMHGVGFRCPELISADLLYSIQIGVGPLHLSSRLRIIRVRSRADGTFDVGAEFC